MKPYPEAIGEFLEALKSENKAEKYQHLVFLAGSAVCFGAPSSIPSVGGITKELVLGTLLLETNRLAPMHTFRSALLRRMKNGNDKDELCKAVDGLAFEQFMSCLDSCNPTFARELVKECTHGDKDEPPINDNHRALAFVATKLRELGWIERVTVITTNYDLCVEQAFKDIGHELEADSKWPEDVARFVPAYCSGDRSIRVVKPHGCNRAEKAPHPECRESSLVFTMEGMFKMLQDGEALLEKVAEQLFKPEEKIKVICIGYSFSDPDLHPLWNGMMIHNRECSFIINGMPGKSGEQSSPNPPNGRDVLRAEMLTRLSKGIERVESSLCTNDRAVVEANILTHFAKTLDSTSAYRVPASDVHMKSLNEVALRLFKTTFSAAAASAKPDSQNQLPEWVDAFLLSIVNAAAKGDARHLVDDAIVAQLRVDNDFEARLVVNHLEQFANCDDKDAGIRSAKALRKAAKEANNGQAHDLILVFEAFLKCVRSSWKCICNSPWVFWKLYLPWRKFEFPNNSFAKAFFDYYRLIILVMSVHEGLILTGRVGTPAQHLLKPLFRALLKKTKSLMGCLETRREVKLMGSVLLMHARLLILLQDRALAPAAAKRASLFATAGGRMTDAALADRWWAHAHLLNGDKVEAMKHFRRGLARAAVCSDGSIANKIARDAVKLAKSCVPEEIPK